MKRKEMLATLTSRIQPLQDSKDGLLRGGFAEIGQGVTRGSIDNDTCVENGTCAHNVICVSNGSCDNNDTCNNNNTCINNPSPSCSGNIQCFGTNNQAKEDTDLLEFGTTL